MKIELPSLSMVCLVGVSGSGKSTFAREQFGEFEVISSDYCRGLVSNDTNDQSATEDAFAALHYLLEKRLKRGLLTVVDATNVQRESRAPLVAIARKYHCLPVAIVLNVDEATCRERNQARPDRDFPDYVIRNQSNQLRRSIRKLKREGFRHVWVLNSLEDIANVSITRVRPWTDRRDAHGPFDIVGDVHGCHIEFFELLERLGYRVDGALEDGPFAGDPIYRHPEGRILFSVGDLVDRGPGVVEVLRAVYAMVQAGSAMMVPGNHEVKLVRALSGRKVNVRHGLQASLDQFEALTDDQSATLRTFMDRLVSHLVLDDGNLVIAHAGMKESMAGRASGKVRSFALYGDTTGETDEFGLPVRYPWARDYRGKASVVYGHTPVARADWLNNTICVDTGCVFGGALTALRWPERELVSVDAKEEYSPPARPLEGEASSAQHENDRSLDLADVTGRFHVQTSLMGNVKVREENGRAALEVMSRFAVDPRWLIYLPPTMSPCGTPESGELLEQPAQAFSYYRNAKVANVVCQQKHMGSRAVVVVCRDADAASERFGDDSGRTGSIYTRTGRPFFNDATHEEFVLDRLREAIGSAGLWDELRTDWVCLDSEIMPWSEKARELLRRQYAHVGATSRASTEAAAKWVAQAHDRTGKLADLVERTQQRSTNANAFVDAYRHYCWPVVGPEDLRVAAFHLMASEGRSWVDQSHAWHMEMLARLATNPTVIATEWRRVDLSDEASVQAATDWWRDYTATGGEGMVVKPEMFVQMDGSRPVQPAVKVRGREYLRIIYGPDYDMPANMDRLRRRGLAHKRSMALREFALGVEGLDRFVKREPLRRVHQCAFAVLAMESEPVDPRL